MKTRKIKLSDIVGADATAPDWNRPLEGELGVEFDVLCASLSHLGQLTPIVVRPVAAGKWQVVMGHRRVLAALTLKWAEIEAEVREMDDETAVGAAFAENYARKPISIYWEAEEVRRWLARGDSQAAVAQRMGRSAAWVKRRAALDLAACRRFKAEVLDPRGIAIEDVHPANLELLGEAGEGVFERLRDDKTYPADYLRKRLQDRHYIAHNFLRSCGVSIPKNRAWRGDCTDPDTAEAFPDCGSCPHLSGQLASLFPELDETCFGWDEHVCARGECMARKKAAWRKVAERQAREKHPKLAILSAKEAAAGTWAKCKPAHPAACIKLGAGDASGSWEIVRPVGEVTGNAETPGDSKWQQERAAWEAEERRRKQADEDVAKLLDTIRETIPRIKHRSKADKAVLVTMVDWIRMGLKYEEPECEEIAAAIRQVAAVTLPPGDDEIVETALAPWEKINCTPDDDGDGESAEE